MCTLRTQWDSTVHNKYTATNAVIILLLCRRGGTTATTTHAGPFSRGYQIVVIRYINTPWRRYTRGARDVSSSFLPVRALEGHLHDDDDDDSPDLIPPFGPARLPRGVIVPNGTHARIHAYAHTCLYILCTPNITILPFMNRHVLFFFFCLRPRRRRRHNIIIARVYVPIVRQSLRYVHARG